MVMRSLIILAMLLQALFVFAKPSAMMQYNPIQSKARPIYGVRKDIQRSGNSFGRRKACEAVMADIAHNGHKEDLSDKMLSTLAAAKHIGGTDFYCNQSQGQKTFSQLLENIDPDALAKVEEQITVLKEYNANLVASVQEQVEESIAECSLIEKQHLLRAWRAKAKKLFAKNDIGLKQGQKHNFNFTSSCGNMTIAVTYNKLGYYELNSNGKKQSTVVPASVLESLGLL